MSDSYSSVSPFNHSAETWSTSARPSRTSFLVLSIVPASYLLVLKVGRKVLTKKDILELFMTVIPCQSDQIDKTNGT